MANSKNTEVETTSNELDPNELVKVNIPITNEMDSDVFVSVNGMSWQIQRGIDVEVPRFVKDILDNSDRMDREAMIRRRALMNRR